MAIFGQGTNRLFRWSRIIAILGAIFLGGYVAEANTVPLGAVRQYLAGGSDLTALGPTDRVQRDGAAIRQISDYAYFFAATPFAFDRARVRFKLKESSPSQSVDVGFHDQASWHYARASVDVPFMDQLSWPRIGSGPYLYQKTPVYRDVTAFLQSPPADKLIGVYDYNDAALKQPNVKLPDYKPATADTTITTPLRGSVTMYAYLSAEPFHMAITKRDLNWYGAPDAVDVSIYKDTNQVYAATVDDDGDTKGDGELGPEQTVDMRNPGPDLPEAGVYKVVIDAPADVVITKIQTNLHKLVFEGPIYPVNNHEVYGGIARATTPTNFYTNAWSLTAETDHSVWQTLTAGNVKVPLMQNLQPVPFVTNSPATTVTLPRSDVIVNGVGYFSFTPDQFFAPTPYHIMSITSAADLSRVDYVLTNYRPPQQLGGGWVQVDQVFDLRSAVAEKGKLSWIIAAPGLQERHQSVEIKDVQMTLSKKGWFK